MADQPTDTPEERAQGLTRNCLDSVRHALAHFSANCSQDYGFHNQKWAILSVAHATEAFCNLLLLTLDPAHPREERYPDLEGAVGRLRGHRMAVQFLAPSERHALKRLFPGLEKQRNQLLHRVPPAKLDAEQAALVLLALLYLVRRRTGADAEELFDGDAQSVFDELGLWGQDGKRDEGGQARWFAMAELLAFEDYGPRYLEHCELCGCFTRTPDRGCLACFTG